MKNLLQFFLHCCLLHAFSVASFAQSSIPASTTATTSTSHLQGETAESFLGHWMTAKKDGIVAIRRCSIIKDAPATAICGVVYWDSEMENPNRTVPLNCNRLVFQATKFSSGVWSEGLSFDPRTRRTFMNKLRMKDGKLVLRSFLGNEMNGENEIFTRVEKLPPSICDGKTPESMRPAKP